MFDVVKDGCRGRAHADEAGYVGARIVSIPQRRPPSMLQPFNASPHFGLNKNMIVPALKLEPSSSRSMVKKQKFTKRTHFQKFRKQLQINHKHKIACHIGAKNEPKSSGAEGRQPGNSFKSFQRLSKGFKAFQRFWRKNFAILFSCCR